MSTPRAGADDGLSQWRLFRHAPLIGTTVEVRICGLDDDGAAAIDMAIAQEMIRLEGIFNAFDHGSELSRWKRDELGDPSPEFCTVMAAALDWQNRSGGRFSPLAGVISAAWQAAEAKGVTPDPEQMAILAGDISAPRFEIVDGRPVRIGNCDDLNLNAIAKGFIVDRALDTASDHATTVLINAGGDLAHRGVHPVDIGVENPLRPFDNEPPLLVVPLRDAAIATSGGARRGFRIDGRRYSHVIDPRTGWTADQLASITVIADDTMTADVVATVLGVLEPAVALAEAHSLGVECIVVAPDGDVRRSANV